VHKEISRTLLERAAAADSSVGCWVPRDNAPGGSTGFVFVSYAELVARAAALSGALQRRGVQIGSRVAFVLPDIEQALVTLLACLGGGFTAVPLRAPLTAAELEGYADRVTRALRTSEAVAVVTNQRARKWLRHAEACQILDYESLASGAAAASTRSIESQHTALLRVSFGSTAAVELAPLTHAQLSAGLTLAAAALPLRDDDVFVSWLPLFEDAGLTALLLPLYCQRSCAVMSTAQFLKRPVSWLEAISQTRATISFAPDHGYAYASQRVTPSQLASLDLSRWRIAGAVGSAISDATAQAFARSAERAGFRAQAFAPALRLGSLADAPAQLAEPRALSHGQNALWYLAQLTPESTSYNVPIGLRIASELDVDSLRSSLELLAVRHAALRSVYPAQGAAPCRTLSNGTAVDFAQIDVAGQDEAAIDARISAEIERRFDLETGPLFVARLFVRAPNDAILLIVLHHINVDGSSIVQIGPELSACYAALSAGRTPELPPLEHTYDDFVRWQAELLAGTEGQRLRRFWSEQLRAAPRALRWRGRVRPRRYSERGASLPVHVPEETCARLRELARQYETTLFSVLLAAFYALLQRESGDEDIVVATPVLGRSGGAFRNIVGYFVNTLPLRARFTPDDTFDALIRQLRRSVLSALDHQDLPYPLIVEGAQVERDPSHLPLCQVLFQLQSFRMEQGTAEIAGSQASQRDGQLAGLRARNIELTRPVAPFELMLELNDYAAGLHGVLTYSTELFDAATAQRLARDFLQLTAALATQPAQPVGRSRALQASQRVLDDGMRAQLARWNATDVQYPQGSVPAEIARRAALQPDATVLVFESQQLTYAELNQRADAIAARLRSAGVGRDGLVGVAMQRSLDLPVVLLGVLKSGGAYVPLDPTLPDARLRFMLEDSAALAVIADERELPRLAALGADGSRLFSSEQLRAQHAAVEPISVAPAPEDLAYVIYTSGSTGTPKGAANTHAGLWNRLCWMQQAYALTPGDCVLQKTPYSFDVSVWELFWPLMTGARLAIARPDGHKDSRYLAAEIERSGVTTLHFVPSMLQAFLEEQAAPKSLSRLKRVICSGEALPYAVLQRCFERLPGVELHNLYGPTEASIDVTSWVCTPNPEGRVSIGRPIANTQIHLLDEGLRQVPIGDVGELYIGGVGLARGYHRRDALTAERFIDNPLPGGRGRLYRTGDLARHLSDGNLEYLGRNDEQIKLRGFRIELAEIEAVSLQDEAVARCAVLAPGGTLVACIVPSAHAAFDAVRLERAWRTQLPEYMVPSRLELFAELPLTHSGKVDRRQLGLLVADRERSAAADSGGDGAPRTPEEQLLVEVWEHVLGRKVSIHDNYFAVGGDSIRSLQVRAQLRARGVELEVHDLLLHQTIAALAPQLTAAAPLRPEAQLAPFSLVDPGDRAQLPAACEDAFPATQLQLGMLYHSLRTAETWAYHDCMSLELALERSFDERALRDALAAVQQRHPALRSAFDVASYRQPLQLVFAHAPAPLSVRDLRTSARDDASALVRQYIDGERSARYQLERAPLFRLMAHVLADTRIRLTFSFHHAILDGWSAAQFLRELLTEYLRATGTSELPALEAPSHSPRELIALERAAIASPAARDYFERMLADFELAPIARWPEALRSGAASTNEAVRNVLELEPALTERLRARAAALQVPLKTLLLAAHLRVVAAFSATTAPCVGRVVHGRPELVGAERVLGLFLNTLPLRVELRELRWSALCEALARAERDAHPHRHVPLRELQRLSGQDALFECGFNFVHFHLYDALVADRSLQVHAFEVNENTGFTLMANFVQSPLDASVSLQLEHDARQIAAEQAQQIGHAHLLALRALADDADALVLESEIRERDERERSEALCRGAGPTATGLLHELFVASARRAPELCAVRLGEAGLSYAELDAWSNAIAQRLLAAGAAAGDTVAVCAEPSFERAASVLGVLKAGCAYLPLDPSFPSERLTWMLQDAGARFALATDSYAAAEFLRDRQLIALDAPGDITPPVALSITPDAPAYVIYTSGSTGRPKGVVMHHGPLVNLVRWQVERSSLPPGAATAQYSAFSFDVSCQELFSTWAACGTLQLVPEPTRRDARALVKLLAEHSVARLFAPVVVLHQLAEVAAELGSELPLLREIDTAGEQLEITAEVRAFFARHPRCRLDNQYGPTETHVATAHALQGPVASWPTLPPIGKPLPGVVARVLDGARRPAPLGVPGELYLSGACVATGYHENPSLTEQRFLPDPWDAPARMYRTGDIVRFLPDGSLEYLGRRDGQVKIRGYRVELAEVEAALSRVGGARLLRAAVIAVPSRARADRLELAAYVVPRDPSLDPSVLRSELASSLPAAMLPGTITLLESLPLTPSGKLDRRALPLPAASSGAAPRPHVAPEGALETELQRLWQEVLGAPALSVTDDFFELGGDSLSAVRLMARVQKRYGVELPISALLEARSVRGLARAIEAPAPASTGRSLVTLTPARPGAREPLYCVHPVGGHVLCYAALARRLGPQQPLYALQSRGLDGSCQPHRSVAEMARDYAAEIAQHRPRGTIHLAGWSFGGILAFEIARILRESGRDIGALVVIDTFAGVKWRVEPSEDDLLECIAMELLGAGLDDADIARSLAAAAGASTEQRFERLIGLARERGVVAGELRRSQLRALLHVVRANILAGLDYRPAAYGGEMLLLRCSERMPARLERMHQWVGSDYEAHDNGWGAHCASLQIIGVPAHHLSVVFEPHVASVAAILRPLIETPHALSIESVSAE